MSVSGIVRRMDELGRIVIPKEIRRTMRIKEGDEMEIFSEGESLVVRKHSRFDGFMRAAERAVALLTSATGCDVFLVAADRIVAAGGSKRKEILSEKASEECVSLFLREPVTINCTDGFSPVDGVKLNVRSVCACPLLCAGDVTGTLVAAGENVENKRDFLMFAAEVLAATVCGE